VTDRPMLAGPSTSVAKHQRGRASQPSMLQRTKGATLPSPLALRRSQATRPGPGCSVARPPGTPPGVAFFSGFGWVGLVEAAEKYNFSNHTQSYVNKVTSEPRGHETQPPRPTKQNH